MSDLTTTTVSLPQHLVAKLEAVIDCLPDELKDALSIPLKEQIEISYPTLLKISQWARTEDARKQLTGKQLHANDYSMISLLSGTITSPLSKFPKYGPPEDPAETAHKNLSDRKAILALVNGLFSVGGAGYAGWWASQHVGWRDEWVWDILTRKFSTNKTLASFIRSVGCTDTRCNRRYFVYNMAVAWRQIASEGHTLPV